MNIIVIFNQKKKEKEYNYHFHVHELGHKREFWFIRSHKIYLVNYI